MEISGFLLKITPNGTYKIPLEKEELFNTMYSKDSTLSGTLIAEKTYQIADGIILYKTFEEDEKEFSLIYEGDFEPFTDEEDIEENALRSTTAVSEPNFDSFPIYSTEKKTFFGKLIQNIFGTPKTWTIEFGSSRRIKSTFYSYDYIFYSEIGVKAWTDKKNWIGWSKTESDELRIGWRGVLLETKIPDTYLNSLKTMQEIRQFPPQYMDLPGSKYKINTSTLIIPNFDADGFEKAAAKGLKEGINFLKNKYGGPQTDLEKAQALLIASRTHIYTYIKNDDVTKYKIESYTQIFASQVKFMITINPYSLPGFSSWSDGMKWIDAIKGTSNMVYPTLKEGEVYACGRFGDCWRGMKIKR